MTDDFDRAWVSLVQRDERIRALYSLIGLTRIGDRPTTVEQLAAVLGRGEQEAITLAWEASRVRPENGRIHLDTPWPGASPRRKLYVGDREIPVSGCAPDLFGVVAVVDAPFRVEDTCPATGASIHVRFAAGGVDQADPPETVAVLLPPEEANKVPGMDIEQVNIDLCVQQPFFASTQAAEGWLRDHPGGRVYRVHDLAQHPFVVHMRDVWRPRILANAA